MKNWFQFKPSAFKCNLYRYDTFAAIEAKNKAAADARAKHKAGLY